MCWGYLFLDFAPQCETNEISSILICTSFTECLLKFQVTASWWLARFWFFRYPPVPSKQERNQGFFRPGEATWNKGISINISSVVHQRTALQRFISEFLFLDTLTKAFQMRNLTQRWTKSRQFFPKS